MTTPPSVALRAPLLRKEGKIYETRSDCRLCGSEDLMRVWSFGETPLANSYLKPDDVSPGKPENFAPLDVYFCRDCSLMQLRDVVEPKYLFDHYLYVSSTSPSFVKHFEDYAASLIERFKLGSEDLVIDVGSNDGILLKPFKAAGVNILGIDPAENVARLANAAGLATLNAYFTPDVAKKVASEYGRAKVIAANNVFAHTDEVDAFTAAVRELLAEDGVFVFEVQYLGDLIKNNLFDIVYHEHVNYYSVHPLTSFFVKFGLEVFDVERVPVHGGSIRVFVQKSGGRQAQTERLREILEAEEEQGLTKLTPYLEFAQRIEVNKRKLREILDGIKNEGKRIAGYGAPAKATTLCYTFGLTNDDLDFIVDDSPLKQGMVMPGTHVPIVGPGALYGASASSAQASAPKADYCIILAWNFAEPIMENHKEFAGSGGKWIIPVPEPKIV